jgi:protein-S-isoprenylcysteine O-methyltransferase Ste14
VKKIGCLILCKEASHQCTFLRRTGGEKGEYMTHHHTQMNAQQERNDLTGEHTVGDIGQIVLGCLFAVIWITDTFFVKSTTFLNQYVPLGARIPCAAILLILSGYLAKTGLSIVFGEERETLGVIRKSVFNVVRHPIYLSEILFYSGLLLLSISLAATVVWLMAIGFLHYISRYEERLLLSRFGEQYAQYMREVPMWIPRPWRS